MSHYLQLFPDSNDFVIDQDQDSGEEINFAVMDKKAPMRKPVEAPKSEALFTSKMTRKTSFGQIGYKSMSSGVSHMKSQSRKRRRLNRFIPATNVPGNQFQIGGNNNPGHPQEILPSVSLSGDSLAIAGTEFRFGGGVKVTKFHEDEEINKLEILQNLTQQKINRLKLRKEVRDEVQLEASPFSLGCSARPSLFSLGELQSETETKRMILERRRMFQVEEEERRQEKREMVARLERIERLLSQEPRPAVRVKGSVLRRVGPRNRDKVSLSLQGKEGRRVSTGHNQNSGGGKWKKKQQHSDIKQRSSQLPDDLVLTKITDQGPRKAATNRIDFHALPDDLVLTELTEDGPRPRFKEDDDRVVMEEDE